MLFHELDGPLDSNARAVVDALLHLLCARLLPILAHAVSGAALRRGYGWQGIWAGIYLETRSRVGGVARVS